MGRTRKSRLLFLLLESKGYAAIGTGQGLFEQVLNHAGDGYQNPDTSSSGDASALAAYDWLAFAIATDSE